ncbi:hypothetical protein [Candidatus Binatus sp.]|uniref:hypothetical protein n=1 Tax=Candidatus Binatus sp. TaxID=2811406 RepID=UPI003CC69439
MAQIRLRMACEQAEENDNRLRQRICRVDRRIERRIVKRALRPPHPVHDASSARIESRSIAHDYARISRELVERIHFSNYPRRKPVIR